MDTPPIWQRNALDKHLPKGHLSRRLRDEGEGLGGGDWRTMGVRLDADLATALQQFMEHDEIDIPVLDKDGRVLGDLRLSQTLYYSIDAGRKED